MQIIQSKLLNNFSEITHTFSTRVDGNLAFHVNDSTKNVILNHKKLAKELNYNLDSLIHMKQIHSNIVKIVDDKDSFINPPICDAVITDKKNTPLMVMVADCAPILFYDSGKKVIAVAHAGRTGAFSNIIKNVLNSFVNNFHSDTKDIIVTIGANIKKCCYEVGEEIFIETQILGLEQHIQKRENSFFLNISTILNKQLLESGILEQNIEFIQECSSCNNDKYFSYRVEKETGRFCGIIYMS